VEEQAELSVLHVGAAVAELGGCEESHSVCWADAVELFFAGVAVVLDEAVLQGVDECIEVTVFDCETGDGCEMEGTYEKMQSPGE